MFFERLTHQDLIKFYKKDNINSNNAQELNSKKEYLYVSPSCYYENLQNNKLQSSSPFKKRKFILSKFGKNII